jgi:general secretion pathway protein K
MKFGRSNRRGVALIIVLMMVSIIVALTIQLNRDTRSEVYGAANISDGIRLRYIAQSGFYVGEALLLADKTSFDALTELWANTEMIALQSEGFFDNGGAFKLAIQDEGGKIAVNTLINGAAYNPLIHDLFLRLLTGPSFRMEQRKEEELIDAIKDWIDADEEVTGGGGAETAYYAGLPRPYAAKNAPIDCIEELLMVKGVTRELFYGTGESPGLVQCMTVFGDGKININTAPKPLLRALAVEMTDGDADWLDQYRRDMRNNLADPAWYQKIPRASGLNIPGGLIKVKSDIFQITAVGFQGRMTEQITGVVKRDADRRKVTLLSWKVE